jgi:phospho-N-acetylmuramoyl-pentapeptide-transferase
VIYELLYPLRHSAEWLGFLNVLRYIPFRTIAATITAMLMSFVLAPWFIRELQKKQIGQVVRTDGPATHMSKAGTPTMGGALILLTLLVPTALWADPTNPFVLGTMAVTAGYGVVGYIDDYLKLKHRKSGGLKARWKLLFQVAIASVVMAYSFLATSQLPADWLAIRNHLSIPFLAFSKHPMQVPLWAYVPFAVLVVVAWSNAVNLTDGLDGLAISTFAISAATFTALAYVTGHRVLAQYLLLVHFEPAAELTIFCGALVGASLGFLWYNSYPADIFMGDVGSLALGGALATVAILIKQEILLHIVGGIFVLEAASVIIQVASFQLTGKRVFKMAPLHHHFELIGWSEPKVITRFIIAAIIFALFSLTTLKLR